MTAISFSEQLPPVLDLCIAVRLRCFGCTAAYQLVRQNLWRASADHLGDGPEKIIGYSLAEALCADPARSEASARSLLDDAERTETAARYIPGTHRWSPSHTVRKVRKGGQIR